MKKAKPKIVVLYGAVAVGKLTIGRILAKKLGYKLSHNHLINDLVWSVFERGTFEANHLIEKLRYEFYEASARCGHSTIITHCYSHDYVSPTGLTDPKYLKTLENRLGKLGAKVYFVHLQADEKTLLNRVKGISRKEHKKLTKVSVMKELLNNKDYTTSAPVKNNLIIVNSKLSPQKVVKLITEYLKN